MKRQRGVSGALVLLSTLACLESEPAAEGRPPRQDLAKLCATASRVVGLREANPTGITAEDVLGKGVQSWETTYRMNGEERNLAVNVSHDGGLASYTPPAMFSDPHLDHGPEYCREELRIQVLLELRDPAGTINVRQPAILRAANLDSLAIDQRLLTVGNIAMPRYAGAIPIEGRFDLPGEHTEGAETVVIETTISLPRRTGRFTLLTTTRTPESIRGTTRVLSEW